jgi:RNA recognition motif-containing protein
MEASDGGYEEHDADAYNEHEYGDEDGELTMDDTDDHVIIDESLADEDEDNGTTVEQQCADPLPTEEHENADEFLDVDAGDGDDEELDSVEKLKEQLNDYKVLAQSLEKRISYLHQECSRKDEVIAKLKKQRSGDVQTPIADTSETSSDNLDTVQKSILMTEVERRRMERRLSGPERPEILKKLAKEKLNIWHMLKKDKNDKILKAKYLEASAKYKEAVAHLKLELATEEAGEKTSPKKVVPMPENELMCKMFVGGLSTMTSEKSLEEYFSKFGDVASCKIMKDHNTKRSRGYGFLIFGAEDAVDKAQAARPHKLDGKVIDTKRCLPKDDAGKASPGTKTLRIFVGGLKSTTEESTVREYFSKFGEVLKIDIPEDNSTHKRRGFCYVTFSDHDPVDKVSLIKFHMIDEKRCEIKKAFTKVELDAIKKKTSASETRTLASSINTSFPLAPQMPGTTPILLHLGSCHHHQIWQLSVSHGGHYSVQELCLQYLRLDSHR